MKISSAKTMQT